MDDGTAKKSFPGASEMASRMRDFDWSGTPLGPAEHWPQALKTVVRILLTSRQPMWIGWGPDLTYLYNDPYKSIIGGKHPRALGQPTSVVWGEIWDDISPLLSTALQGNEGTYVEEQLLVMRRNGFPEETYYTFSYSPIANDDGSIGGIFCANTDDTERVIGERRLALLRELAARTADARTWRDTSRRAIDALSTNPRDVPFAMLYMTDGESREAACIGQCGIEQGHAAAPERVSLDRASEWPYAEVLAHRDAMPVVELRRLFGDDVPRGAWRYAPTHAVALAVNPTSEIGCRGALVVGLNPLRPFDANYQGFLGLVASQIAASIANADAYEQEKHRTEALAADKQLLQRIVSGASLTDVLEELARATESQSSDGMLCSVLVADESGKRLLHGAAPSLPDEYNRAIDGLTVGPSVGSCGTAAFERRPVFVSDIAHDPLWADYRPLAAAHGLAACCSTPVFDLDGSLLGTIAMYYREPREPAPRDRQLIEHATRLAGIVLARERAERKLRDNQQRLRAALSNSATGTFRWDPETGEYLEFDENLKALFGLDARRQVRWLDDIIDRIHPEDAPGVMAAIERRRDGSEFEMEFRVLLPKGEIRWLYDRARLWSEGGARPAQVVGACTDITRQKLAEQASARLAAIVQWSDDAIVSKDLNGIVTSWNHGAERIFGYCAEETVGRSITMLFPEDHLDEEPRILERIARGEAIDHYETVRRRKDGQLIDVSLTVSPIFNAQGQVVGASKIARDVTDRKRLEDSLREADRRKDEFLATLAHELRNPLAPLRQGLELLRAPGGLRAESETIQRMMERQVDHMVRLVDDLMEVSRITRGKFELRMEQLDLATVITGALETSKPFIEAAGHVLDVRVPDEPLIVCGDAVRLSQVLTNLLNNATKYTPENGRIWLSARRAGEEAVISVRDNGLGIPAEMLPKVFQMFTQIDRHLKRAQGGLGIGLTLVKSLVQMHGGSVEVASAGAGQGSEFTLRLPLAPQSQPVRPSESANGRRLSTRPRRRVLVVDDNRDCADSLAMLLRVAGDDVRVAYDGPGALEVAAVFHPEVVLLDIGMPGMSGYDLAGALRQREEIERLVLIAMTGWGQEDDRRRTREAGFHAHLVKPVAFPELQALLENPPG